MSNEKKSKGILFNTFIITSQRIASAALGLVTTPIILNVLGVADYGLYTLIVGFVGALAFVNWSLTITTQRYIAFAIGERNIDAQKKAFVNAMVIHFVYALFICLLIYAFSFSLEDSFLNIPAGKEETARTLIIYVSLITFFTIISVPFQGILTAHENFTTYAVLNLIGSVFKFGIAGILLIVPSNLNKLEFYSLLLLISTALVFLISIILTRKKYVEARFNLKYFDVSKLREMLSFMGWNIFGSLAVLSRNQGISVILNVFFGVLVNAAYGIAMQINSAMGLLTQGIIGSITPKILKNAGSGDTLGMYGKMMQMTKFSLLFSTFFAVFFLSKADVLLKVWLINVPQNAVLFSQMIILFSLSTSLSGGLQTIFNALGKMKLYSIYVSTILLLNIPIAYTLFKMDFPHYTIFLVAIFLEIMATFVRLFLLKKFVEFSILSYCLIVLRGMLPAVVVYLVLTMFKFLAINELFNFVLSLLFTLLAFPVLAYLISLNSAEKEQVKLLAKKIIPLR